MIRRYATGDGQPLKDDQYVLNLCAKYLARHDPAERHRFPGTPADDPGIHADAWRFPVIDTADPGIADHTHNVVTFVYDGRRDHAAQVEVAGTFAGLYETAPLRRVLFLGEPTGYFAVSIVVPKRQVHRYLLRVDGRWTTDPVNPQTTVDETSAPWSRFFTDECPQWLTFDRRERDLLRAMVNALLPFQTREYRHFVSSLDHRLRDKGIDAFPLSAVFDEDIGVANYIDKALAREERHRLIDYRIALDLIGAIVRTRTGLDDVGLVDPTTFTQLFDQMAGDRPVPDWDHARYDDASFFLGLLRRHTVTGAFSHPRYGGNRLAAGWLFLQHTFRDRTGGTHFDWEPVIEPPIGTSTDYRG